MNQLDKLPVIIVFSIFIFVIVYVINIYNIPGDILQYSTRKQNKSYVLKLWSSTVETAKVLFW